MLSVHDDLIRAIKFIPAELRQKHEEVEKLVEGIEMTAGNLEKVSVILFFFLFFALPFRVPGAASPHSTNLHKLFPSGIHSPMHCRCM